MNDKIKDRLRKLRALTSSPNSSEAESAKVMFLELLKKYNILESEITDEALSVRIVSFKNSEEDRLLAQIIYTVINHKRKYKTFGMINSRTRKKVKSTSVELTDLEYVQIKELFDIYRKELKKAHKDVYQAFIIANNVYPSNPNPNEVEKEMTNKEYDDYLRALSMSRSIDKVEILKKICK